MSKVMVGWRGGAAQYWPGGAVMAATIEDVLEYLRLKGAPGELVKVVEKLVEERDEAVAFERALRAAGVDNWVGWDDAMDILHGEE